MKLYNTLTREKVDFQPLSGNEARIYSCGPTVYNTAHIGNLRTYIFMDELRRVLRRNGYTLKHVMNITDVGHLTDDGDDGEDKLAVTAREQKVSPWDVAARITKQFFADIDRLNIEHPEIVCKATDHINEMIAFVEALYRNGYAYETSDGIYFDIGKLPTYGQLSRASIEQNQAGARVEVNSEKRHPADFALWKKAAPEHIMQWLSPWGQGYPGWHIECSAMGLKYLGEHFDIHTGGVDAIPIHHENEIAQAVGCFGRPAADIWMHGEFLLVDGGKMSKSLGNGYTIDVLAERGYDPLDYRYFCLNAHYSSKLNFTFEGLDGAKTALGNLRSATNTHKGAPRGNIPAKQLEEWRARFDEAVNDDLNIPKALGVVWSIVKHSEKSRDIYELMMNFDEVFAVDITREAVQEEAPAVKVSDEVLALVEARTAAKKAKNFNEADRIRDVITELGYSVIDTPDGPVVR